MTEETLFAYAVQLPVNLRAEFLERECAGHPELKARIESLLGADSQPHSPLDRIELPSYTTRLLVDPNATEAYTPAVPDSTQTHIHEDPNSTGGYLPHSPLDVSERQEEIIAGRYRLLKVIGEGGMGSVYLAEQSEPVKRQVALKLIRTGMDSRSVLARFDAERQALALMDHPNIARIYDGGLASPAGHDGGSQPFFVMELVKGVPLTEYCDRERLSIAARLNLFVQVCNAVQHAHQKGIIHRDLKPGNVLVTEVDERPVCKVIDFGVAKATEQQLTDLSFADTGLIVGTPAYMSPEQADPSLMDIDTRTDVYALGVMLYELLTGTPPIDSKQFKRGAILEMLWMVREVDPPKPSTRLSTAEALPNIASNRSIEPAQLTRLLRGELDWVVMKALEKNRDRRYESANGLATDLLRYLADEVVEARPPSTSYLIRKFVRRHKASVLTGTLITFAILCGLTAVVLVQKRSNLALEAKNAELATEKSKVEAVNQKLTTANQEIAAEKVKVEKRFDMARKAIAAFHTTIDEQPELGNEAFRPLRKKLLAAAAGFYRELEGLLASETDAKSRKALADGYFQLAELTAKIGDKTEALAVYRKALAIHRELAAVPGADEEARLAVSVTVLRVGSLLADTGETAGALRACEEARDLAAALEAEASTEGVRQILAASYFGIGVVLRDMDRPGEALSAHQQARDLRQKLLDAHLADPGYQSKLADSYNNIGNLLRRMDKPAEAMAAHQQARDLRQKLLDAYPDATEYQSDLAQSHDNIATCLRQSGKAAEALAARQKALAIRQRLADVHPAVTQFHSELADSHHNIGIHLDRTGRPAEALAAFEKERDIRQKLFEGHPTVTWFLRDLASNHDSIGIVLARTEKTGEALAAFEKSRDVRQKLADANPTIPGYQRGVIGSLNNLGQLHARQSRLPEAFASLDQAISLGQKLVAGNPTTTNFTSVLGYSHAYRGWARVRAAQPDGAAADLRKAVELWVKDSTPSIETQFEKARALALLAKLGADAKSGVKADEAKVHADQAVVALADAIKAGSSELKELQEPDFDTVRDRDDFKKLIAELEAKFPPAKAIGPLPREKK